MSGVWRKCWIRTLCPMTLNIQWSASMKNLSSFSIMFVSRSHPCRDTRHGSITNKRCGTVNLFIEFEPLTGQRSVTVTERRTSQEYAARLQALDRRYPEAKKIRLIQDQLSTHSPAALYDTLPAEEANRLRKRFEWIYTPKHASWLNMAEMEWAALQRQCLDRRIAAKEALETEVAAWERHRNARAVKVNWEFTTQAARGKMARHYKQVE